MKWSCRLLPHSSSAVKLLLIRTVGSRHSKTEIWKSFRKTPNTPFSSLLAQGRCLVLPLSLLSFCLIPSLSSCSWCFCHFLSLQILKLEELLISDSRTFRVSLHIAHLLLSLLFHFLFFFYLYNILFYFSVIIVFPYLSFYIFTSWIFCAILTFSVFPVSLPYCCSHFVSVPGGQK